MKKLLLFFASATILASCSDNDTVIYDDPSVNITSTEKEEFTYGQTREFPIAISDSKSITIDTPEGWNAAINDGTLTVTAPAINNADKQNTGKITVTAKGYNTTDATASINVTAFYLITFEDVKENCLAGPTSYGENLYPQYNGASPALYTGYLDTNTDMFFHTTTDGYGFASGGMAISRWNNMTEAGYTNQCSVYYGDSNDQNGGYDNSSTFCVSFCPTFGQSGAYMYVNTDGIQRTIDHMYVTNATYTVLSMKNGDSFAKKFSYEDKDWFKLTISGTDVSGTKTGEVEVYLADFRTPEAYGILTEWKRVDLSTLGQVHRLDFTMSSSDGEGMWMNTPAYFCLDDIAIFM